MSIKLLLVVALLVALVLVLRTIWVYKHLNAQIISKRGGIIAATHITSDEPQIGKQKIEQLRKEHYKLSFEGSNPFRVVAITYFLNLDRTAYERHMALTSDYYGQTKYLLKKGRLPTAFAFWMKSRHHAEIALEHVVEGKTEPLDYEVLGAPSYLASKIPLLGIFWKDEAGGYLDEALICLILKKKSLGDKKYAVSEALIASKLWTLKPYESYRTRVKKSGIKHTDDHNQLKRVAKHLGFKTVGELLNWVES